MSDPNSIRSTTVTSWNCSTYNRTLLVPHGRMWKFDRPFDGFGRSQRFPGQEPVGNYPIHILVNGGHIILEGVVDSQMDKDLAGIRARGVSGAFSVDNELQVEQ
jgi:hypothetical protein